MTWGITYRPRGIVPGPGDYPPPEDGPTPCLDCLGTGKSKERIEYANGRFELLDCRTCLGMKHIDEAGVPVRLNCWGDRDYGRGFAQ